MPIVLNIYLVYKIQELLLDGVLSGFPIDPWITTTPQGLSYTNPHKLEMIIKDGWACHDYYVRLAGDRTLQENMVLWNKASILSLQKHQCIGNRAINQDLFYQPCNFFSHPTLRKNIFCFLMKAVPFSLILQLHSLSVSLCILQYPCESMGIVRLVSWTICIKKIRGANGTVISLTNLLSYSPELLPA